MMKLVAGLLFSSLVLVGAAEVENNTPRVAQVVALDECDPATFNAPGAAGADFCKNVALGASTTFSNLLAEAAAGTPDPKWDFEPDVMTIKEGTILNGSTSQVTGLSKGEHLFQCCIHPWMRSKVIVK
jgi:plastocyanin